MKKNKITIFLALMLLFFSYTAQKTQAATELITNGGFETGNFTGWTTQTPAQLFRPWSVSTSGAGGNNNGQFSPVPTATVVQQGTYNAWNGVVAGAGQEFIMYQDVTIPAGSNIQALLTWNDRYQMNYTQFCTTDCGTATYRVEILSTANVLRQTLYVITTTTNTNTNTGYVQHTADLRFYAGQAIRIRFRTNTTLALRGVGQLEIDAVSLQFTAVTAADATISGRATTDDGKGISAANVTLTDQSGNVKNAMTNPFGIYSFDGIESGQNYVVRIGHKKYVFPNNPRVINVNDNAMNVDFQANP